MRNFSEYNFREYNFLIQYVKGSNVYILWTRENGWLPIIITNANKYYWTIKNYNNFKDFIISGFNVEKNNYDVISLCYPFLTEEWEYWYESNYNFGSKLDIVKHLIKNKKWNINLLTDNMVNTLLIGWYFIKQYLKTNYQKEKIK